MSWTAKKIWIPEDEVLEDYLNEQVYGNTLWMYERPYQVVVNGNPLDVDETDTTDYSPAGMVYKNIAEFAAFTLLEETTLEVMTNVVFTHTVAKLLTYDMVLTKDGGSEYYYSTGTTTKPTSTQAALHYRQPAGTWVQSNFRTRMTLDAGEYTAKIGMFFNAAGGTLTRQNLNYLQTSILRVLY